LKVAKERHITVEEEEVREHVEFDRVQPEELNLFRQCETVIIENDACRKSKRLCRDVNQKHYILYGMNESMCVKTL
jgi:hypothetical protein